MTLISELGFRRISDIEERKEKRRWTIDIMGMSPQCCLPGVSRQLLFRQVAYTSYNILVLEEPHDSLKWPPRLLLGRDIASMSRDIASGSHSYY